jgi:hypothetical protein
MLDVKSFKIGIRSRCFGIKKWNFNYGLVEETSKTFPLKYLFPLRVKS